VLFDIKTRSEGYRANATCPPRVNKNHDGERELRVPRPRFSRKTLETWQNTKGPLGRNVRCMGMSSRGEGENEGTYERENFEFTSLSPRPLREISRAPFFVPARCVLSRFCLSPSAKTANFSTSLRLAGAACFLAIYVHVNILQNEKAANRCASWTILHPAFVTRDVELWKKYGIRPQYEASRGRKFAYAS